MRTVGGAKIPLYEYKCKTCGQVFEHLQKHPPMTPFICPNCNTLDAHVLFPLPSPAQYKGAFYIPRDARATKRKPIKEGSPWDGKTKPPRMV